MLLIREISLYLVLVSIAACGVFAQLVYRVPGTLLVSILPLLGLGLIVLGALGLARHLSRYSLSRRVAEPIQRTITAFVLLFGLYSGVLYINGRFDHTPGNVFASEIVEISDAMGFIGGRIWIPWARVRHWSDPQRSVTVLLWWHERNRLWGGEVVKLEIRPGHLATPWVYSIAKDEEYYLKDLVKAYTRAAAGWRRLIYYYLERKRVDEAADAVRGYLLAVPGSYLEALTIGITLKQDGRFSEAIPFLEYVIDHHPVYEAYQQLGWILQQQGDIRRAAELFEASLPLKPDYWEAYFHLGEVYAGQGLYVQALGMYERVLKIQPEFVEVESAVGELRSRIATIRRNGGNPNILRVYCQPWTAATCRETHVQGPPAP